MGTTPTVTPQTETTAAEQPMSLGNYVPSFLRESQSANESTDANNTPEPVASDEPEVEGAETDTTEEDAAAGGEILTPEDEASEETDDESAELPIKQLKDYESETYAAYAKRYGKTLEDVQNDATFKRMLKEKIDSDVYAKQLRADLDSLKAKQEVGATDKPETEAAQETTPAATGTPQEQHRAALEQFAEQVTSPEMATQFTDAILESWGFDPKADDEATKALRANAPKMAKAYTIFGANLVNTMVPMLFEKYMENAFPGFKSAWDETEHQRSWETMRRSDEKFKALPVYQSSEFVTLMAKAKEIEPDLDKMEFRDAKGKSLPKHQQIAKRYQLAARLVGQPTTPTEVVNIAKQAAEAGKKQQQAADKNARVARVAGSAGHSKGNFAPKSDLKGSGMGIIEAYQKGGGALG